MKGMFTGCTLAVLTVMLTGCFCCRQEYDPCIGWSYKCKQWGFAKLCGSCCNTCGGRGCTDCNFEPGCESPMTYGAETYEYPSQEAAYPTLAPQPQPQPAPPMKPEANPTTWHRTQYGVQPVRYQRAH